MILSLKRHEATVMIFVLCLDSETKHIIDVLALEGVYTTHIEELVTREPRLSTARKDRSRRAFIWTITPLWIRDVLFTRATTEMTSYVDADLYFFSSANGLLDELGKDSISLIPHRFSENIEQQIIRSGIYNVGMMTFRRTTLSAAALDWWSNACLAHCEEFPDGKVFGDQKYLDGWGERMDGTKVINNVGANLAPWNINQYGVTLHEGKVMVDETQLIFYHFHGVTILASRILHTGMRIRKSDANIIYVPYAQAIDNAYKMIWNVDKHFRCGITKVTLRTLLRWLYYRQFRFISA